MQRRVLFVGLALLGCQATPAGRGAEPPARRSAEAAPAAAAASEQTSVIRVLGSEEIEQLSRDFGGLRTDTERKSFVDRHVLALTETYVRHHPQMKQATRTRLIELICELRDARTEPALRAALQSFVQQRPTRHEDADIKWVLRAAAELKLPGLSQPLIEAYDVFEAHTLLGGGTYKDLAQAMFEIADPSWAPRLRAKLASEIRQPKTRADEHLIDAYRDQIFWQTSAAQVLGSLRDAESVEPLFRVLLDPAKSDLGTTALLALVKIGRPARTVAAELLRGARPDLVEYYEARSVAAPPEPPKAPADATVETAAAVLGSSGHSEASAPLLEFLKTGPKPKPAAHVAYALTRLPPNAATKAAFKKVLFATPKALDLSVWWPARATLLESAVALYDPVVVEWCLEMLRSEGAKDERGKRTRSAGLTTALNLVDHERLPLLRRVVDAREEPEFLEQLEQVATLVDACQENAACYLGELSRDGLPKVLALKAGTMLGVYGDEASRDALIDVFDRHRDAAVRFGLGRSVEMLTPNGSATVTHELQQIVDASEASGDPERIMVDASLKQVIARLEGRLR